MNEFYFDLYPEATFNNNGFYLQSETTYDQDGEIETYTYSYDSNGNLTKETYEEDDDGDGAIDYIDIYTYIYDNNGNLIKVVEEEDDDGDGVIDEIDIYTYTYDNNGNLIKVVEEEDDDGDGVIDEIDIYTYTYTYDNNGNILSRTSDYDGDGTAEYSYTNTYDSDGNLISETYISTSYDRNGDGQINEEDQETTTYNYTYDVDGDLIKTTYDYDNDGVVDRITTFIYDTNKNILSETSGSDSNGDGEIDEVKSTYTYAYDADGNLIEESYKYYSDYSEDYNYFYTYSYAYDTNGNLIEETYDNDSDGTIDKRTVFSYDSAANLGIEPRESPSLSLSEVHRFFQYEQGYHFYSADTNEVEIIKERSNRGELAYNYEQEKYKVLADNKDTLTGEVIEGVKEVHRFFNTQTGAHLYTMDDNEKDAIQANLPHYNYEEIAYYAFDVEPGNLDTIPVYRMLNNSSGAHLFSIDSSEIAYIQENLPHFSMENNGNAAFYVIEL